MTEANSTSTVISWAGTHLFGPEKAVFFTKQLDPIKCFRLFKIAFGTPRPNSELVRPRSSE